MSGDSIDQALRDLYQEVILDHGKRPRNRGRPAVVTGEAQGNNPICGDRVQVFLALDEAGRIAEAGFEGRGCAISLASASMMTEALKGKTAAEAERLFQAFQALCTGELDEADAVDVDAEALERLKVLSGVRAFPARIKCATLAWHTMKAALEGGSGAEVTTE